MGVRVDTITNPNQGIANLMSLPEFVIKEPGTTNGEVNIPVRLGIASVWRYEGDRAGCDMGKNVIAAVAPNMGFLGDKS